MGGNQVRRCETQDIQTNQKLWHAPAWNYNMAGSTGRLKYRWMEKFPFDSTAVCLNEAVKTIRVLKRNKDSKLKVLKGFLWKKLLVVCQRLVVVVVVVRFPFNSSISEDFHLTGGQESNRQLSLLTGLPWFNESTSSIRLASIALDLTFLHLFELKQRKKHKNL